MTASDQTVTASAERGDAAVDPETPPLAVVETPTSPSVSVASSRFEFEKDCGNEGTKVLMVEWDTSSRSGAGARDQDAEADWEVTWEGKTAVLPTRDVAADEQSAGALTGTTRRVYFLLPPGAPIPALVDIAPQGGGEPLRTRPMPAIFPGAEADRTTAGTRGVLHKRWARARLAELDAEMEAEMQANGESVGLEMALQEKAWIVSYFGLDPAEAFPEGAGLPLLPLQTAGFGGPGAAPPTPISPRSPIGGRLAEKLRGLKLATSPAELAAAKQASKPTDQPQSQNKPPFQGQRPGPRGGGGVGGGVASLDPVMGGAIAGVPTPDDHDNEEDLFALPMSPRSPDMARSPFSTLPP